MNGGAVGLRANPTLDVRVPESGTAAPGERVVFGVRSADVPIEGATLWVNGRIAATLEAIGPGSEVLVESTAGDRAGLNVAGLRGPDGEPLGDDVEFFVRPDPVPLAAWEAVTEERLPRLLAAGGPLAPRGVRTGLPDPLDRDLAAREPAGFPEERGLRALTRASDALLAVTPRILRRLSFRSRKEVRIRREMLKGRIHWQATLVRQASHGAEGRLDHVCERTRRTFATPTNLLFVAFHAELVREGRRAMARLFRLEESKERWRERLGSPTRGRAGLVEATEGLESRLRRHVGAALHPLLAESFARVREGAAHVSLRDERFLRACEKEARRQRNRAYRDLVEAWRAFATDYPTSRPGAVTLDAASLEEVYNVWVALEIARAIGAPPPAPAGSDLPAPAVYFHRLAGLDPDWIGPAVGPGAPGDTLASKSRPDLLVVLEGGARVLVNTRFRLAGPDEERDVLNRTLGNCAAAGVRVGIVATVAGPPRAAAGGPREAGGPWLLARVPFGPERLLTDPEGGAAAWRRVLDSVAGASALLETDPEAAARRVTEACACT